MSKAGKNANKAKDLAKLPKTAPTVAICYVRGGQISANWQESLERLRAYDQGFAIKEVVRATSGANITKARNELINNFLSLENVEWAFLCDTDMVFPANAVDRLLLATENSRKIVGGLCFMVTPVGTLLPTLYDFRADGFTKARTTYEKDKGVEVAATGAAFMLVHRSVFENIRKANPNKLYPFYDEYEIDGHWIGEDISFCMKAQALGHKIYVDTSLKIGHEKPVVLTEA